MMSRIDRIRRAALVRRAQRAEATDTPSASDSVGLPVVAGPRSFRDDYEPGEVEFFVQLAGQDGQRRGLRGGPSLLRMARAAYNRIEWSGSYDRRARKGRQAKTDV